MKLKGEKRLKKENKLFIIFIIIFVSLLVWAQYEYKQQQEETNRIVKELQRKTAELEDTYIEVPKFYKELIDSYYNYLETDITEFNTKSGEKLIIMCRYGYNY